MRLEINPDDIRPIVAAAVEAVLARRAAGESQLGPRLGFPEAEAAQLLGIEQHVLRDARLRGEINAVRLGRQWIYSRETLLKFLGQDAKQR